LLSKSLLQTIDHLSASWVDSSPITSPERLLLPKSSPMRNAQPHQCAEDGRGEDFTSHQTGAIPRSDERNPSLKVEEPAVFQIIP
jgi:hypothetical protein